MAGKVLRAILMVAVLGWGVPRCASPEPRMPPQGAVAKAPVVKPAPKPKPAVKPAPKLLAVTGCSKLLDAYRHEVSHIPYPANMPYLPLLKIGEKLVARAGQPDMDPVCQAQLHEMMSPLFGYREPGVGRPPTLPKAGRD